MNDLVHIALNEYRPEHFEIIRSNLNDDEAAIPREMWDKLCATRQALQQAWDEAAEAEKAIIGHVVANDPDIGYPWDEWARGEFVFHWRAE